MLLANLYPVTDRFPFPYTKLTAIAGELGIEVQYPDFGTRTEQEGKIAWNKVQELIENADAFVLESGLYFEYLPELERRFHERIQGGGRAFIIPAHSSQVALGKWNKYLAPYNISPTWVKLVGPKGQRMNLRFCRQDDCFRDHALLMDVDAVVMDAPFALWHGGESWPVLVGAPSHWSVDAATDFPAEWNGRELACMAAWYGSKGGGMLVASANSFFTDPCTDPLGQNRPGIDNNLVFARNVLKFLSEGKKKPGPEEYCKRIEINLVDFVLTVLKGASDNWWNEFVPPNIAQKCTERQKEEGNRFEKVAYLDLISLKALMDKNWKLFKEHFEAIGFQGGKKKALAWMNQLNRLRRLIGHPLKKHVSGYTFSREEQEFLAQCDSLVLSLVNRVQK